MYFPKRLELSFLTVLAFPNDSKSGAASRICIFFHSKVSDNKYKQKGKLNVHVIQLNNTLKLCVDWVIKFMNMNEQHLLYHLLITQSSLNYTNRRKIDLQRQKQTNNIRIV